MSVTPEEIAAWPGTDDIFDLDSVPEVVWAKKPAQSAAPAAAKKMTPEEIAAEWPAGDDVFDKEGLPDVIWDDRPVDSPEEIRAKYYKVLFNTGRDAVCGKCGAACAKCGAKDNQKIENP